MGHEEEEEEEEEEVRLRCVWSRRQVCGVGVR
jgi:hypothetical protein